MKIEIEKPYSEGDYYIATLEEPRSQVVHDPFYFNEYNKIDAWCEQSFGTSDLWGENTHNGWKRMMNKYYFTDESKLNWFMMRWS
jgi:hypothetical protein